MTDISGVHDGREIPAEFLEDAKRSFELGQYDGLRALKQCCDCSVVTGTIIGIGIIYHFMNALSLKPYP